MSYPSARDLPSFVELSAQANGLQILGFLAGKEQRQQIKRLKSELDNMINTVDQFYELLGDRHWVFHDTLNMKKIEHVINAKDADAAEKRFISLYDADTLRVAVTRCYGFEALRKRQNLVEKARDDYLAERYYACILVLLAVMDGFVNDFETIRRGLHARQSEELGAWDTVISHHKGIEQVHRVFTKQISSTITEPVYELYRNGIMHGTVTNFDNIIVATKAWNMFFAIMDWASAKLKAEKPKPPEPSLRETLHQMAENKKTKKLLSEWQPYVLQPSDDGFSENNAYHTCNEYLALWKKGNYGGMVQYLMADTQKSYSKAAPSNIRREYSPYKLENFAILQLSQEAAAICEIKVQLTFNDTMQNTSMRWIYEDNKGNPTVSTKGDGGWKIILWGPAAFLQRQNSKD